MAVALSHGHYFVAIVRLAYFDMGARVAFVSQCQVLQLSDMCHNIVLTLIRTIRVTIIRHAHTGILQLPSAASDLEGIGHAHFSIEQLEAELDYLLIPKEERKMSFPMHVQSASLKLEQAVLRGCEGLEDLAELLMTCGVEALLSMGTTTGYLCCENAEGGQLRAIMRKFPTCNGGKFAVGDGPLTPAVKDTLLRVIARNPPQPMAGSDAFSPMALEKVVDAMCRPLQNKLGVKSFISLEVLVCGTHANHPTDRHYYLRLSSDPQAVEGVLGKASGLTAE